MPSATEEPNTMTSSTMMIDEIYEFSAPCFFDFIKDETDDDKIKAELWFDSLPVRFPIPLLFSLFFSSSIPCYAFSQICFCVGFHFLSKLGI
ncbi:hypothetical protein RchiOBHm_Chr6g0274301 [Rosa chinensis]|uniref:Uncharacterized protein n=1 Tax=Rosa chinensis TaxID=74649 RepID=A0A2P6PRS9_ROSCH|nr:hypothetical protein RchiOBHm_Chr6g0274301 [Rosa chinensis]